MKYFYIFLYIVSAVISISIFLLTNITTERLNGSGGGNGNPGLMFILFLYPFLLIFIFWTVLLLRKWMIQQLNTKKLSIITLFSFVLALLILILTFYEAITFREEIVRVSPSFDDINQVSLLNTFSNSIFFNQYTFLMLLLLCLSIAGFSVFIVGKKKENRKSNF